MALLSGRVTAQAVEESHAGAFHLHLVGYDLEIPPDFAAPALVRLLECLERRQ
jgi:sugar/nucleoside kinase (ribokinase family)